jgi:hypothetical protein
MFCNMLFTKPAKVCGALLTVVLGASLLSCGETSSGPGPADDDDDLPITGGGGSGGTGGRRTAGTGGTSTAGTSGGGNAGSQGGGGSGGSSGAGGNAGSGAAGTGGRADAGPNDRDAGTSDAGAAGGDAGSGGQADAAPPPPAVDPRSPVLPVLWIDVSPVNPDAIAGSGATTKTKGKLKVYYQHLGAGSASALKADLEKRTPALETPIGIKRRGKASQAFPKKPYTLDLLDEKGQERGLPFLGMPKDADWVMHPCYADISCIRNALVYELAQGLGRYNARSQHVEVFINGQYWGHYLVVEKPKFDNTRIPLKRAAATKDAGDLTGGYLIRNEFLGNGKPTDTVKQDWVSRELPIIEDISSEQRTYIQGVFNGLDALAKSAMFGDRTNGYEKLIDVPSWIDFALFQEFTNNCDAYLKSIYMQKLPDAMGGKIALGPLWDFDFALANVSFRDTQRTDVWAFNMNRFGGEMGAYNPPGRVPYVPLYWEKLWKDAAFTSKLKCRWRELRKAGGVLDLANINAKIDMLAARLAHSEPRDHMRWPTINNPMACTWCGIRHFPNYKGYVDYIRDWIRRRVAYMDANLPGTCQ